MLRISRVETDGNIALHLEGKLLAPWIEEVEMALALAPGGIALNLKDLSFVDRAGAVYLRGLQGHGVPLTDPSPLVAELLRGTGTRD